MPMNPDGYRRAKRLQALANAELDGVTSVPLHQHTAAEILGRAFIEACQAEGLDTADVLRRVG